MIEIKKGEKWYPVYQESGSDVSAIAVGIMRLRDGFFLDWSDSTFKNSGWTTKYRALAEQANGLWTYAAGWVTPNVAEQYAVHWQITDSGGTFYRANDEQISVVDVQAHTVTVTPTDTTPAGIVALIDGAIADILAGRAVQSYTIGGRNLQHYSLGELKNLRAEYQKLLSSSRGRSTNYVSFGERG